MQHRIQRRESDRRRGLFRYSGDRPHRGYTVPPEEETRFTHAYNDFDSQVEFHKSKKLRTSGYTPMDPEEEIMLSEEQKEMLDADRVIYPQTSHHHH